MSTVIEKLKDVELRLEELTQHLSNPNVIADRDSYRRLSKERSELEPIVASYQKFQKISAELEGAKEILEESVDEELREMALRELNALKEGKDAVYQELMIALLPKDPNDQKNIIL